jgi:hypothetical protein
MNDEKPLTDLSKLADGEGVEIKENDETTD